MYKTYYKFKARDRVRVIITARERKGKLIIIFGHPRPYEITNAHNNSTVTN